MLNPEPFIYSDFFFVYTTICKHFSFMLIYCLGILSYSGAQLCDIPWISMKNT